MCANAISGKHGKWYTWETCKHEKEKLHVLIMKHSKGVKKIFFTLTQKKKLSSDMRPHL